MPAQCPNMPRLCCVFCPGEASQASPCRACPPPGGDLGGRSGADSGTLTRDYPPGRFRSNTYRAMVQIINAGNIRGKSCGKQIFRKWAENFMGSWEEIRGWEGLGGRGRRRIDNGLITDRERIEDEARTSRGRCHHEGMAGI